MSRPIVSDVTQSYDFVKFTRLKDIALYKIQKDSKFNLHLNQNKQDYGKNMQ